MDTFDSSKALEIVDGDKDLFQEIAKMFLENLPHDLEKIRDAITNNDAHMLEQAAHSLKGAVGNFSAKLSFEAAYRLERLGKENKMAEAQEAFKELENETAALEVELNRVLMEI